MDLSKKALESLEPLIDFWSPIYFGPEPRYPVEFGAAKP